MSHVSRRFSILLALLNSLAISKIDTCAQSPNVYDRTVLTRRLARIEKTLDATCVK